MARIVMLFALLIGGGGGAEEPVDIGDEGTGGGAGTPVGAVTWEGYVENPLASGSDFVRIVQNADGTGTLRFGEGAEIEPATDPEIGYPQSADLGWDTAGQTFPIENFTYSLDQMTLDSLRLQLALSSLQVWGGWCAMQTPVYDETNGIYGCLPNIGGGTINDVCFLGDPNGENYQEVDCGKLGLCNMGSVCTCDAEACAVNGFESQVSLARTGDRLDGDIDGVAVHLEEI
jgi:hypothetical protein